jgi:hypothetical protein
VRDVTPPVAIISMEYLIDQGDTVELNGSSSTDDVEVTQWKWNITHEKGNRSLSGQAVQFTFEHAGVYNVTLVVRDLRWNEGEETVQVRALDTEPPVAVPPVNPLVTRVGTVTVLDGSRSHDNVGIVAYSWQVQFRKHTYDLSGDGAEFKFKDPGQGVITLVVEDAAGLQHSTSFNVIVEPADEPVEEGLGWTAMVAIAVVVVAVVVAVMLWLRRRGS